MELTNLDEPYTLFGQDNDGAKMYIEQPITQEQADKATEIRQQMMDALAKCSDGEAADWIAKIGRLSMLKVSKGKAFTHRNAILASLFAPDFPLRDKDTPETPQEKAHAAALAMRVHEAGEELELKDKDVKLIKKYTFECNQSSPVVARLFNALDGN